MRKVVHRYEPAGRIAELWQIRGEHREVLLDGPAGTGKSRAAGEYLHWLATEYPGARILVVRKTRVSLTESWMVTFEEHVLPPKHPAHEGPGRANRHSYEYPNGSVIVLGGLDRPTRLYSTEWDIVYVNEATELVLDEWERFHRALRHGVVPWQMLLGDCNPDAPTHWLNRRCNEGRCHRIYTRHRDNLRYYNPQTRQWTQEGRALLEQLNALTGVRRDRLLLGKWVAAEGQIWENFDPATHVISHVPIKGIRFDAEGRPLWRMVVAGVDWGWRDPGVILVFGVDQDGRMYKLHEIYRCQVGIDQWVKWAKHLQQFYRIQHWACDPSEPGFIQEFRKAGLPAKPADNEIMPGLDAVRNRLEVQDDGRARLYFLDGTLRERDSWRDEAGQVCGLVEEIPEYVYRKAEDGKPIKEEPEPSCQDHGCDALRYVVRFVDRTFAQETSRKIWKPGTLGRELDHPGEHTQTTEAAR